jgi:UDP-2-acetamido-3-amino-2,3-dideoxy-glucuronate N-acetyltransferase
VGGKTCRANNRISATVTTLKGLQVVPSLGKGAFGPTGEPLLNGSEMLFTSKKPNENSTILFSAVHRHNGQSLQHNNLHLMNNTKQTCDTALIGGGYWGKNLARNFLELGALHTICDASETTLASFQKGYESVRKSTSFDSVLADDSVNKIAIAAPAEFHFRLAKAALEQGKDVFVEKPLCLTVEEGEELVELSKDTKRILMVGHLLQYHPCVEKIRELIARGELGRLQYITSNRLNLGKIRREENALWSFAPHDLSVILSLVGNRLPESLQCTGESWLTQGVADATLTAMKFDGSVRAHVFVSWLYPFKEQKLTVIGSRAMVVFDDTLPWNQKLLMYRHKIAWQDGRVPMADKADGEVVEVVSSEPLRNECNHFLECCHDRTQPRTDGVEGLQVLKVLAMAQQSLESEGRLVTKSELAVRKSGTYFAHESSVIDSGAKIGDGSKIWHFSHVSNYATIGENCNLGQNVFVASGVSLGNNVKVQNNVSIYTGTVIHDDVFLGPSCVLTNISNPRSQVVRRSAYEKTVIKRGASVGANATIVCGVTLGRYCFIAAGAVVTCDVADYALMMGVPAKQKGWMSRHGHPLHFAEDCKAICPESRFVYVLEKTRGDERVRCLDLGEEESLPKELSVGSREYDSFKR